MWSSLTKFVRIFAWITRFLLRTQKKETIDNQTLSYKELQSSELQIWKMIQKDEFEEEMKALSNGKSIKKSSRLIKLKPLVDNGLLRVGGRLEESALSDTAKHQIILPSDSPAVKLLVRATHVTYGHCGQNHLMSQLRKKYWIVRGNAIVKTVIRECVHCRKLSQCPVIQRMADLLEDRVCPGEPPFTYVGTDCFGPFLVKQGRSQVKRWGAIFTCLTSLQFTSR